MEVCSSYDPVTAATLLVVGDKNYSSAVHVIFIKCIVCLVLCYRDVSNCELD